MAVEVSKTVAHIKPNGGEDTVDVEYDGYENTPVIYYDSGGTGWLTVTGEETAQSEYTYTISASQYTASGTGIATRVARVRFSQNEPSAYTDVTVYQSNGYLSIWQDTSYLPDATAGDEYIYKLKDSDDTTFFAGVSAPVSSSWYPDSVDVARLSEYYLYTEDYDKSPTSAWKDLGGTFEVDFYKVVSGSDVFKKRFYFFNDWSNKTAQYKTDVCLNDPINGHGCKSTVGPMLYPFCIYNATNLSTWGYRNITGSTYTDNLFATPSYDFNFVNVQNSTVDKIAFKRGTTFYSVYDQSYCGKGVLYYRNRFGGYDAFLIEGNIYKNESYTKEQYTVQAVNTERNLFSKITDKNKITTTWQLNTCWLTDEQAERLVYHLLSSPKVYFKPFGQDTYAYASTDLIAVNITDTSAQYKRFENGRKLISYTINIEESQTKSVKQ